MYENRQRNAQKDDDDHRHNERLQRRGSGGNHAGNEQYAAKYAWRAEPRQVHFQHHQGKTEYQQDDGWQIGNKIHFYASSPTTIIR